MAQGELRAEALEFRPGSAGKDNGSAKEDAAKARRENGIRKDSTADNAQVHALSPQMLHDDARVLLDKDPPASVSFDNVTK